ncbi:protein translocase subunit SecD [Caldinitratiruptor microaerophilus]|uniref:Protein translocase subunit SecD n=1 Tax=Caldinitratiruptor microaerophilus TaxID=671077 RepID=A0AA35G6Q4_9FIRM|nr:protein translocase subunit SecD [Caldinitratiruptor microaerophilus]BDG59271.1 protein translocase subunit SecD [Caldinitratiruptor microaerophilus]
MRVRSAAALLALLLLIGGAGYYFLRVKPLYNLMKQGLDIKGGVRLVLEGVDTPEAKVTRDAMQRAMDVIEYRVNKLGVSEPNIQLEGDRRIIVELADVPNVEQARQVIGKTALLKFVDPDGNTVLTGKDLVKAQVIQTGQGRTEFGVSLELSPEGTKKFADATTKFVGRQIAIYLDEDVISAPVVNEPIPSGRAQITGNFTAESAKQLADLLNGGALPVKLNIIENRTVSATLGRTALALSLRAGLIGLGLVAAYMVLFYRVPGLLADFALVLYLLLTLGVLYGIGAVLTLPGIAGIVLSLGMAVDANVLIFERVKDELRRGTGLRSAIDAGFKRAFSAILDSNVTTVVAAAVLYWLGTGPIRGFGLTLGLGVLISMFTAITFSRWLLKLAVGTGWFGPKTLFGAHGMTIQREVTA